MFGFKLLLNSILLVALVARVLVLVLGPSFIVDFMFGVLLGPVSNLALVSVVAGMVVVVVRKQISLTFGQARVCGLVGCVATLRLLLT